MSEHPLLFTVEMVRAVLDGRKTHTRRVPIERYRNWKVGDTIWVRETFRIDTFTVDHTCRMDSRIYYKADENRIFDVNGKLRKFKWKPSIHMNKIYARLFLEITGLRVERVQDINGQDCKAEGVQICFGIDYSDAAKKFSAQRIFKPLWDSINAKRHKGIYAWDKNPEVKVIEFKVTNAKAEDK